MFFLFLEIVITFVGKVTLFVVTSFARSVVSVNNCSVSVIETVIGANSTLFATETDDGIVCETVDDGNVVVCASVAVSELTISFGVVDVLEDSCEVVDDNDDCVNDGYDDIDEEDDSSTVEDFMVVVNTLSSSCSCIFIISDVVRTYCEHCFDCLFACVCVFVCI